MLRRLFIIASIVCTALASSQAPEFAQQYRQRLGGAIDELRSIVSNFDKDASNQGLSREQALAQLANAEQPFFQSRANSMQTVFNRYTDLTHQQQRFNSLNSVFRPVALLSTFDQPILNGAWRDYQPALPLTLLGALWTAIGAVLGWITALIMMLAFSAKRSKRRRQDIAPEF